MRNYRCFKDSWSVNSFKKRFEKGLINFDNPIQRGLVWNKIDSSLYLHSLLYDVLIYQKPFLVSKKDEGWDILDGKQRGTSLMRYIDNEYSLRGLEKEPLIMVDGEPYNINGKYFKQLPDELQMKILDFQIDMAVLEDAPVELESLFFNRSNSGRAMTKLDMARSKNNSIDVVKKIAQHKIFSVMFTKNSLLKLPQDEVIVKTWQALNETEPDFSAKHFNEIMEDLTISEEDMAQIESIYDIIYNAYKIVFVNDRAISNMMLKKTHLLSYVACVEKFSTAQSLANWAMYFFGNLSEEYIKVSRIDTVSTKHTSTRLSIVKESIEKFI